MVVSQYSVSQPHYLQQDQSDVPLLACLAEHYVAARVEGEERLHGIVADSILLGAE